LQSIINIIEKDNETEIINSSIILISKIVLLKFIYKEGKEFYDYESEIEILLSNGEHINIYSTTSNSLIFKIFYDKKILETSDLQKFKEFCISVISNGVVESDE